MKEIDISIEALLADLMKQGGCEEGEKIGFTTFELSQKCGRSERWVQSKLRVLHKQGLLSVRIYRTTDLIGRDCNEYRYSK
jgi:hypothetical protein